MQFSLKVLLMLVAFVSVFFAGVSTGKIYKIVDYDFVRHQLQVERAEIESLKAENAKLRSLRGPPLRLGPSPM